MTTPLTRREVQRDARSRASRTWWQGLASAVLIAALAILAGALVGITPDEMFSGPFWVGLGVLLLQAAASATGSYIQRTAIDTRSE